jgi:hypothetical protein
MNIVSLAMQFLGPAIIGKIASSLGINQSLATKAIGAIVPTILAGVTGAASKPGGGQLLSDALSKQDGGLLGNLGNLIGGGGQADLVKNGTSVLGSLLGGSAVSSLAGAVGKFAGVSDNASSSLIGMLAPAVLGTLGQQQKAQNLDAGGLVRMLEGQKQNVAEALPKGFSDLLGGTGLLDSIGPQLRSLSSAASTTSSSPRPSTTIPPAPVPQRSGSILPWVIGGLAALLLGWYLLGSGGPKAPTTADLPNLPRLMVDGQDISGQTRSVAEGLAATLRTVKDDATAKAALPKLQDASKTLDTLTGLAGKLPAADRKTYATGVSSLLPILAPLADKILAQSGVSPILKPIIEAVLGKLGALAKS